jgi:hypothetical protein
MLVNFNYQQGDFQTLSYIQDPALPVHGCKFSADAVMS